MSTSPHTQNNSHSDRDSQSSKFGMEVLAKPEDNLFFYHYQQILLLSTVCVPEAAGQASRLEVASPHSQCPGVALFTHLLIYQTSSGPRSCYEAIKHSELPVFLLWGSTQIYSSTYTFFIYSLFPKFIQQIVCAHWRADHCGAYRDISGCGTFSINV